MNALKTHSAVLAAALAACSAPQPAPDAGSPADSGAVDAGVAMTAVMSLFELATPDGGMRLTASASIGLRALGDGGCTAVSRTNDSDGAWLRISGYRSGGQPTLCTNEDGGYVCRLPSNAVADVVYGAGSDPLGPGPILFAVGGGADIGPATVRVSPGGTLAATLDGATLRLSCSDDCSGARVIVLAAQLVCDLAFAPEVVLPFAPGALSVVRSTSAGAGDGHGALLIGRVGRGVAVP